MKSSATPTSRPWTVRLLGVLSGLASTYLASCSLITGADEDVYRIRVDSISAPAKVGSLDTLRIVLHGVVGPDGCYRFDRIESRRLVDGVELAVWGVHDTSRDVGCTLMVVPLNESHEILPPFPLPFTLFVRQPDGSRMERPIPIE